MLDLRVFELRQYTMFVGKRDTLVSLFEKHFIEPQNALGAHVVGTFNDMDDPDRFVWIRGFSDMSARKRALETFYNGPTWERDKAAANATMADSDNVLLLRPAGPAPEIAASVQSGISSAVYGVQLFYLSGAEPAPFCEFFDTTVLPRIRDLGIDPLLRLVSEEAANDFPRLPTRRESVFVWMARWKDIHAHSAFMTAFHRWTGWRDAAPEAVFPALMRKPEILRLSPTPRSALK